jgi:CubicO group peptidase (beta-lactamase class C family)
MSNSAADGAHWASALDEVVAETAAGRLLPGVHRCLPRVETPRRPEGWTRAATTHHDDHTSGLPNFFSQPPILEAVRQGGGRRRFTPADLVDLAVAGEPPTLPPGTARSYTDTGFLLAGLVIEALTGRPLQEAYRELVLDSAGMTATWLESSDEPLRRRHIAPHDFEGRTSRTWIRRSTGRAAGWSAPPPTWPRSCEDLPEGSW